METDQAWETNVPFALGNTGGFNRHNAQWYSFGNWFLYQFNEKVTGVWRSEIFRDNTRPGPLGEFLRVHRRRHSYKPKPYIWFERVPATDFIDRREGLQRQHTKQPVHHRVRRHLPVLSRSKMSAGRSKNR